VSRGGKIAVGVAVTLAALGPLTVFVLFNPYRLPSESMVPTYDVGDRVVAGRDGFPFGAAGRGDVVILTPPLGAVDFAGVECAREAPGQACAEPTPERADVKFIQRIVATGGERLKLVRGRAHVNGRPLDEPYVRVEDEACELCNLPREITVPDGHVFVMGDNRSNSNDSRVWGPVPEDWIEGKVLFKYWSG
jgi:signal peptidase I